MQLGRSSKSKNRSLNLRLRQQNRNNDVITESLTEKMNFEGDNNNAYRVELDVSFEHESDIDNANGDDGISLNYEDNNDNADGVKFDNDISFEYEDDNDGVEFDGDARDPSENIDSYNDNNDNSENILENSSLPNSSFNGEFGPYFSSSTSASIFAWITKHMIFEYFTGDFVHVMASNKLNCMRIISIVLHEEELKLKLQRFLSVEELPGRLKMTECSFNSNTDGY
ncbi:unnamed protein product [Rhizophagus irregularis]|nr:unnamed protein product [Rhizophagus irregularis]